MPGPGTPVDSDREQTGLAIVAPDPLRRILQHRVYPYLLKGFCIERPNHVWSADIERHEAFSNLAVVRDHHRLRWSQKIGQVAKVYSAD